MKKVEGFLFDCKEIKRIVLPSEIRWDALTAFLLWWNSFGIIVVWLKQNFRKIGNEFLREEVKNLPSINQTMLDYYKRVSDRVQKYRTPKNYFEKPNHRPGMLVQALKLIQTTCQDAHSIWNPTGFCLHTDL